MRAIKINPVEGTIEEVEYDGDWKTIGPMCSYQLFTLVRIDDYQSLYVDDEGLFVEGQYFFQWSGYPQPLGGVALILGSDDDGESQPATITLDEVKASVSFLGQNPNWRL